MDRDAVTLGKIEKLARNVLGEVNRGKNPAMEIRTRTLSNVAFNEKRKIIELGDRAQSREFFNTAMARKFMQTMLMAKGCKSLIDQGKTASIRQMYYISKHTLPGSSENTFEEQSESDPIIEDLEVGIDALARGTASLRQPASGVVVGRLTVIDDAGFDRIDLSRLGSGGWSDSQHLRAGCDQVRKELRRVHPYSSRSKPSGTAWARDRFWEQHNCILLTSEGQAARGARRLLQRMSQRAQDPDLHPGR